MTKLIALTCTLLFALHAHASQKVGSFTCNVFVQAMSSLQTVEIPLLDVTNASGEFMYEQTMIPMTSNGVRFKLGFVYWLEPPRAVSGRDSANPVKLALSKLDKTNFYVAAYPENIDQLRNDAQNQPHQGEFNYAPASFSYVNSDTMAETRSRAMGTFLDLKIANKNISDTIFVECVRSK